MHHATWLWFCKQGKLIAAFLNNEFSQIIVDESYEVNVYLIPLQWCHNERDSVSNNRRLDCLFNRLFRCRLKKSPKLHVTGLCKGNPPVTAVNSPHKGPVTRKMFPFDNFIMYIHAPFCYFFPIKRLDMGSYERHVFSLDIDEIWTNILHALMLSDTDKPGKLFHVHYYITYTIYCV